MHPAALMQSRIHIVGSVEVRAQDPLEACAEHSFDHLPASRVMVLVIAPLRRTSTPDVAIHSLFAPARFIHLHRRAGANLLPHLGELRLHLRCDALGQSDDLPTTDPESMQVRQIRLDLPYRQAHHRAQIGSQTGNLHAEASLSHHLLAHIQGRFPPGATVAAPAVVHDVLGHFHGRRRGQFDHLSPTGHADASQRTRTHWTVLDTMLNDLRWGFALPSVIVLGIALLQLFDALVSRCQLLVQRVIFRLHCAHLLQVLALPFLGLAQLLQHLIEPFEYLAESLVQVGNFFFLRHDLSLSDKDQSEQYRDMSSSDIRCLSFAGSGGMRDSESPLAQYRAKIPLLLPSASFPRNTVQRERFLPRGSVPDPAAGFRTLYRGSPPNAISPCTSAPFSEECEKYKPNGSQPFEEQWQEEVIRGLSPALTSPAEKATRIS